MGRNRIPHRLVQLPALEPLQPPLRHLPHNLRRTPGNDAKTRHHHVTRDDRPVQNLDVVLDDGKVPHHALGPDAHVRSHARRLDDRPFPHEHVVPQPQRHQYLPIATAVFVAGAAAAPPPPPPPAFPPPPPPPPPAAAAAPAAAAVAPSPPAPPPDEEAGGRDRVKSPRIITSGCITVLPPSMMFCVPTRLLLRATLLPVSFFCRSTGMSARRAACVL
ncbi:uncharacterized protein MKZ38_002162 [Zalerion maritima]|uniref:Uncharacterized protein n=1 Tax=Zalerion maritima TaxID=339359 RepID=A0AAD5RQP4_9PEZI|nr:uncharacterized protein MKZ38_002162 [Zalerion maritima]